MLFTMKNAMRILVCVAWLYSMSASAVLQVRNVQLLNDGWKFHFGSASQVDKDFKRGTEYFNYLTKAHSIHNEGPYIEKFDDSDWTDVTIPHDWVVDLPFASEASHSHGYKTVGWKYPETSVGWYRKKFTVPEEDYGRHFELQFDGIFRDAEIWVNGFYMGGERSGYISQVYDITDYLNYGGENVICVRADASLEEGWFYEGGGIYRDVWLRRTSIVHVKTNSVAITSSFDSTDLKNCVLNVNATIVNDATVTQSYTVKYQLLDADGNVIDETKSMNFDRAKNIQPKAEHEVSASFRIKDPHLWDLDDPYLYKVRVKVVNGAVIDDIIDTNCGIRDIRFTAENGFFLNGKNIELKGVNCHQDHAGVGSAIPDALQAWRIKQLKALGCNAYRSSHNPMTPALLDICDREGMLVIEENRLMGINDYQLHQLKQMIDRDRNHPSIIMWSDGNEEWGLENSPMGMRLAESMREYTSRMDPTRPVTVANAGGNVLIRGLEVVGYNYIMQNNVEQRHKENPEWKIVGTEETTACGTRGIYFPDPQKRWMPSINRTDSTYENIIERGWKFYHETPWASGIFYWTGFDYRGEPNPLAYPAVGSQFGILDYCGFPKDEAYYLKSWWTDETILHIFPHWNLQGHEGETVSVWAYSNCDEVELFVNGKSAGRKAMPRDGHLTWDAVYQPGSLRAIGYRDGKRIKETIVATTGDAAQVALSADRQAIKADGRDLSVMTVSLKDKKGRVVPTACNTITVTVTGDAHILGVGNGDPAFKGKEHATERDCKTFTVPAFNGYAQVLIQSNTTPGTATVTVSADGCKPATCKLTAN